MKVREWIEWSLIGAVYGVLGFLIINGAIVFLIWLSFKLLK